MAEASAGRYGSDRESRPLRVREPIPPRTKYAVHTVGMATQLPFIMETRPRYAMKPRSARSKRSSAGKMSAMSLLLTPNHAASVAAYWSSAVVGITWP